LLRGVIGKSDGLVPILWQRVRVHEAHSAA